MILLIDNYDSFTYNLYQYFEELGASVKVYRNDKITIKNIQKLNPMAIIISPGPGRPEDAGLSTQIIQHFCPKIPILGVCLGHQAIAFAFGSKIKIAPRLYHGKVSLMHHNNRYIFKNIPNPFPATRYHSLIIDNKYLSNKFHILAKTDDGIIMSIKHKRYPLYGMQFHPESIMTTDGKDILSNFLKIIIK